MATGIERALVTYVKIRRRLRRAHIRVLSNALTHTYRRVRASRVPVVCSGRVEKKWERDGSKREIGRGVGGVGGSSTGVQTIDPTALRLPVAAPSPAANKPRVDSTRPAYLSSTAIHSLSLSLYHFVTPFALCRAYYIRVVGT